MNSYPLAGPVFGDDPIYNKVGPPVVSGFITPINNRYIDHKP